MNKILTTGLTLFLTVALLGFSQQAPAATRTVLNSADSGTGSLRQTIADASSGDIIQFAVSNITLSTALEIDKALTFDGGTNGVTLSLAASGYRHIHINITGGYTLTLQNMTLTGNSSGGGIEGIGAVTATNCVFTGNNGDSGGALHISGTVDLTNCKLTNNSATCQGGGIWANVANLTNCTVSGNTAGSGGGILAYSVTLNGCTVSGNSAPSGSGGGIFAYSQSATLVNCTVAGNTASSGGGIYAFNLPAASFTLTNCTVSGNFAPFGGGIWSNANPAVLTGSVVAGNYAPAGGKASEMWVNGSSNSVDPGSSYYIAGIPAGGLSSLMQTTTVNGCEVGLLAGNGGPTQTILPAPNSPMLDAIPATDFSVWNVTADQRGNPRPTAGFGTIGAVEATHSAAPAITAQPQDMTLTYGDTGNSLSIAANSPDGGTLSYQWYVNTTASNAGGSLITGATGNSFTPPSTTVGTQYYYVVVTNTKGGFDIPTSATTSNVGTVMVHKATTAVSLAATGGDYSNNSITLTVAVSNVGTGATPTGTITFKEGDTELAIVPLGDSGVAIYVVPSLIAQGIHTYTAEYSGDDNYNGVAGKSCTVDVSEFLLVSPTMLNFNAAGETKTFTVACNNPDAHWTLGNPASWLTISSGDDGAMLMKADANPTAEVRYALVVFSIPGVMSQSIAVTQDAAVDKTAIESVGAPAIIVYSQNGDVIVKSDVPVQRVAVYDVSGKVLKAVKGIQGFNGSITISGLPKQQVLIVKVTTQSGIRNYETTFDVVN